MLWLLWRMQWSMRTLTLITENWPVPEEWLPPLTMHGSIAPTWPSYVDKYCDFFIISWAPIFVDINYCSVEQSMKPNVYRNKEWSKSVIRKANFLWNFFWSVFFKRLWKLVLAYNYLSNHIKCFLKQEMVQMHFRCSHLNWKCFSFIFL